MIDIHCHLIPGIDDGAKDIADALKLLSVAQADGTKRMVITPHLHLGRFDNSKAFIESEFNQLKQAALNAGITIELAVAAEVRFDSEILHLISDKQLPFYGQYQGQQFMLLELPHSNIPAGVHILVKYLRSQNITPVIAHPERNRDLLKAPEKINQLVRLGCWFQLTAGSIVGRFGEACEALALKYLDQDIIQIVASDGHNLKHRPPVLSEARARVIERYGEKRAQALFWQNPYNITETLFS